MKNNRCRYLSLLETRLKPGLVPKFASVWERYAEPSPCLTCRNPQASDECNIDSEFTYQWSSDHFQSVCLETIPNSSFHSGVVLLTWLLVHCSAPLCTSWGPLPSSGIPGRVCLRYYATCSTHAISFNSYNDLQTYLWGGHNQSERGNRGLEGEDLPGAPPLVSGRAELPTEVCLSS